MLVVRGTIVKRTRRVVNLNSFAPVPNINQQVQQLANQVQNGQPQQPPAPQPEGKSFSKVTYDVIGEDNLLYHVTDVEPENPYPKNEALTIPVQIKVFVTRKGTPGYELAVAGGDDGLSEEF